jgi:drug/metabolite transporter (DMT)-like permease
VMLVLYIAVILAFIGDVLIFKASFGKLELFGAFIVTVCTFSVIVNSLRKKEIKETGKLTKMSW